MRFRVLKVLLAGRGGPPQLLAGDGRWIELGRVVRAWSSRHTLAACSIAQSDRGEGKRRRCWAKQLPLRPSVPVLFGYRKEGLGAGRQNLRVQGGWKPEAVRNNDGDWRPERLERLATEGGRAGEQRPSRGRGRYCVRNPTTGKVTVGSEWVGMGRQTDRPSQSGLFLSFSLSLSLSLSLSHTHSGLSHYLLWEGRKK